MDPLTGLMVASYVFQAWGTSEAQRNQGRIAQAQANFQATQFEINADWAEIMGEDALERGDEQAIEYQKQINAIKAKQRVGFASQGVQVDSGTAMEIQEQTAEIGAYDVTRIKNNAWREAFGYRQDASRSRFNARSARIGGASQRSAANAEANMTLLGGAINVGGLALMRKNAPKNPNPRRSQDTTGFGGTTYGAPQNPYYGTIA